MSVKWFGNKLIKESMDKLEKNMNHIGEVLASEMRTSINRGPKTGRLYFKRRGTKGKRGKVGKGGAAVRSYKIHQASAPGEPPATDTGVLAASITQETKRSFFRKRVTTRVGTNKKEGFWLEFGTKRIKPRPFARRALHKYSKKLDKMAFKGIIR